MSTADTKLIEKFCSNQDPKLLDKMSQHVKDLFITYSTLCISRNEGNKKIAKIVLSHFDDYIKQCKLKSYVSGLRIIPDFITKNDEKELLKNINNEKWSTALSRKTQHYGYEYDYTSTKVKKTIKIPKYLQDIIDKLMKKNIMKTEPNQVIINEYEPGQGIGEHIDHVKLFGSEVTGLSLGSQCCMTFTCVENLKLKYSVLLPRRSLLIMKDDSRYIWKHSITARKSDMLFDVDKVKGKKVIRDKRISVTFRRVKTEFQ